MQASQPLAIVERYNATHAAFSLAHRAVGGCRLHRERRRLGDACLFAG